METVHVALGDRSYDVRIGPGLLSQAGAQIAPLQATWSREAAEAYRVEQARWEQAAAALNDILVSLGNAVRDGADDVAATDRSAARAWGG